MNRDKTRDKTPGEIQSEIRSKLRAEIHAATPDELVPHQRRDALLILSEQENILDAAVAIATDDKPLVQALAESGRLTRPTLADLANACLEQGLRYQFVILQPYVLAQKLPRDPAN